MGVESITSFKSRISRGGLRPTQFECELTLPQGNNLSYYGKYFRELDKWRFLCKSVQVPSSQLTTTSVGLPAGGALKLPSSRIFEPWSVSVISDDNMLIRAMLEDWSRSCMGHQNLYGSGQLSQLFGTAMVRQLSVDGEPVREYYLEGLYPMMIDAQDLSADATDTISEFGVTFNYQYHETGQRSNDGFRF